MLTFFLQSFVKKGENSAEKVSELSLEKGEEVAKVRQLRSISNYEC